MKWVVVQLFLLLIQLLCASCQCPTQWGACAGGPLSNDFDLVKTAAQAARDAYHLDPPPSGVKVIESKRKGRVELIVGFQETSEMCIAAFATPLSQGFSWVRNIDMSSDSLKVKGTKKKCKVVRHYKRLYENKSYKKPLDKLLKKCWKKKKFVLLTGHGLGGAMANLAAFENSKKSDLLTITFGQPPVFMPPQYEAPGHLSKKNLKKHPCKHFNAKNFYQFVNTDVTTMGGHLLYDFISFFHYFVYGMIDGEAPQVDSRLDCLHDAASNARKFLLEAGKKGNLGSNFGSRYLLPPVFTTGHPSAVSFREAGKDATFQNQDYGVKYIDLLAPELLETFGAPHIAADCVSYIPKIHDMETYLGKMGFFGPEEGGIPGRTKDIPGFFDFAECNLDSDCASDFCFSNGYSTDFMCLPKATALTVSEEDLERVSESRKPPAGDGGKSEQSKSRD